MAGNHDIKHRLSRQHEADIHELLGGHSSKSSGNQWHDAADGKHDAYEELAFAWDCKCVMPGTKSLGVSRDDLGKITEQGRGRKPMLPIRFYATERGAVEHDWISIRTDDMGELLSLARVGLRVRDIPDLLRGIANDANSESAYQALHDLADRIEDDD
jgi:hypothetical protein